MRVGQKIFWMKPAVVKDFSGDVLLGKDCEEYLHFMREVVNLALKSPTEQVSR